MQKTRLDKKLNTQRIISLDKNLENLSKNLVKAGEPTTSKALINFLDTAKKTATIGFKDFIKELKEKYPNAETI
jgi:hypothetical protein